MNKFKNKNLGKYLIGTLIFILFIVSNISLYNDLANTYTWESGTVVGKNDVMSTGKHHKQQFIIAFDYDNYGTEDVVVSFSTWNKLNIGDRTSFKYHKRNTFLDAVLWVLGLFFDTIIGAIIITYIGKILVKIWNY